MKNPLSTKVQQEVLMQHALHNNLTHEEVVSNLNSLTIKGGIQWILCIVAMQTAGYAFSRFVFREKN